jgi:hypothetical protein
VGLVFSLGLAMAHASTGCTSVPINKSGSGVTSGPPSGGGGTGSSSGGITLPFPVEEDASAGGFGCTGATLPQPNFGSMCTSGTAPPPISGGTLLVTQSGTLVVLSDPDRDAIYVVDVSQGKVLFTIPLQAGDEPGRLAEDAQGLVHVALRAAGALVTINPTTGALVQRRTVCPAPRGVTFDPTRNLVWVACATGELVGMPPSGGQATTSWVVERDLRDVLVSASGALTVSEFRSAQLLALDNGGNISSRTQVPAPDNDFAPHVLWRSIPTPTGGTLCVHQEHSEQSIDTEMPGGYGGGSCGTVLPEGVNLLEGSSGGTFGGSSSSGAVGFSPPAAFDAGTSSQPMGSVLTMFGVDGSLELNATFDGVLPVDVAISLDGSAVAVATPGSAFTQSAAFVFNGTAVGGTGTTLPFPDNAEVPIAVGFDISGDVLVQTREPATLWGFPQGGEAGAAPWSIPLSNVSRCDTGHDIFHTHAGVAIACASCHPEGGDDGHVWILNGDQRRTPSLRGTIAGTAPYHWPGDEADLPVLVNDVYTVRMAGQSLPTDQMGALTSWVQAIPPPPAPSWVNASAAAAGEALFDSPTVGCATCHNGAKFTNNQTLDVGTGGAFQVPPLVGVGWRTPLLHNGCAATIADRFGMCSTPQHGTLTNLSATDLQNLEAFLETL